MAAKHLRDERALERGKSESIAAVPPQDELVPAVTEPADTVVEHERRNGHRPPSITKPRAEKNHEDVRRASGPPIRGRYWR